MADIQDKLLIVRMTISKWNPWGYDHKAAETVAATEGSKKEDTHVTKRKISKAAIKKVSDVLLKAYITHFELTMPSGTEGDRLITTDLYTTYCEKIDNYKAKLNEALDEFVPEYPQWIEEAKNRLGGLFKEEDYPPPNEIRGRFSIMYRFLPFPSSASLTVNLLNGQLAKIRQSIEEEVKNISNTAMKSLWDRIYDNVAHMAERLGNEKAIFRDSLVGNVKDLCELLKSLNFNNDPDLESMRLRVETKLSGQDPDELRKSRNLRLEIAQEAKAIVTEISEKRKLRLE